MAKGYFDVAYACFTGADTAPYRRIAAACADEIMNGGFLTDCGLLENVSTDGKPLDAPAGRIINPS